MNGLFGSVGGVGAGQPQSPFMDMMGRGQRTMQSGGLGQPAALPPHMLAPLGGAPAAPVNPQRDAIAETMTQQGTPFTPPTAQAPPSFTPGGMQDVQMQAQARARTAQAPPSFASKAAPPGVDPFGLGRQSYGDDFSTVNADTGQQWSGADWMASPERQKTLDAQFATASPEHLAKYFGSNF